MDPVDPRLSWLAGRRCKNISIDVSGTYFELEGAGIRAGCPWRILERGRIALGSVDHEQKFGLSTPIDGASRAQELLDERRIRGLSLLPGSADLIVDFGDDVRLEIWNNSVGYEGWHATGPNGREVIALGGGELAILGSDAA